MQFIPRRSQYRIPQAPTWTTAASALDVTLECSDAAGLTAAQALFPKATDNCDADVSNIVKVSGAYVAGGLCPESGSYINTWTVTDACGNVSAVYTQTITIRIPRHRPGPQQPMPLMSPLSAAMQQD